MPDFDDRTIFPETPDTGPTPPLSPTPPAIDGTVYPSTSPGQQSASCPACGRAMSLSSSGGQNSMGTAATAGRFGPYELLGEIAKGGMGIVYRARDTCVNHVVALKIITAGDVQLFLREVKTVISLDHPHVLPIHEYGEFEDCHYFTMPLMTAGSLQDLLRKNPLPPRKAARLVKQAGGGVQYAHERGIIHGDIKPQNILLTVEGGDPLPRLGDSNSSSSLFASVRLGVWYSINSRTAISESSPRTGTSSASPRNSTLAST